MQIKDGYVLFWGDWPSNWYLADMIIDFKKYNCVEQYMMYQKAITFNDSATAIKIMQSKNPKEQKKLGRSIANFSDNKWDNVKYSVVLTGTLNKYKQNEDLKKLLLETEDNKFVECSPYDKIWGIGLEESSKDATKPGKWLGNNLLGKAIDEARSIIRKEIEVDTESQ